MFGLLHWVVGFRKSSFLFFAGETATSRGLLIEKKIEFLESLTGKVHLFPFRYLCLKQVFYYLWLCFSLTIITERKMGSWMHMVHQ